MSVNNSTTKQWEQLYARLSPVLFQYGCRITAQKGLIEDCIHDVFVRMWGRQERFSEVKHLEAYLTQSFRHHLFAKLKEEAGRRAIAPAQYSFFLTLSQEDVRIEEEISQEQRSRINAALHRLSPRQREAVYLRFFKNHCCDEVARIMDLEKAAVYSLIYKALSRLRDSLQAPREKTDLVLV